jgi:hypothetical protein
MCLAPRVYDSTIRQLQLNHPIQHTTTTFDTCVRNIIHFSSTPARCFLHWEYYCSKCCLVRLFYEYVRRVVLY